MLKIVESCETNKKKSNITPSDINHRIRLEAKASEAESDVCSSQPIIFSGDKENRITLRAQETTEVINNRLSQAYQDILHYKMFQYIVVNDNFDDAVKDIQLILKMEKAWHEGAIIENERIANHVKSLQRENQETTVQEILATFSQHERGDCDG